MSPSIDVVIPIHGGWPVTRRCLQSLAVQSVAHRQALKAAANAGAATGGGEVVVMMNNDVEADPDFLERLVAPLDADPHVGMVAPLLLRPGRGQIDGAGLVADRTLSAWPRLQGRPAGDAGAEDGRLLGPSGAAAAFRRAALDDVGGLDERIFMYQEDLDVVLRMRAAGWGAALARDARAVHLGGSSAGRRSAWQRRQAAFARGYLLRRWGVLRGRAAARALATELAVVTGDLVASKDLVALSGRVAGWREARGLPRHPVPGGALDGMGLRESVRRRRSDYSDAAAS